MNDKRLSIDLSDELGKRFKIACASRRKTQKEIIIMLIKKWLKGKEQK